MSGITAIIEQTGRYKIQQRLGSGGMATVYKAEDLNLQRPVAIKILHEHLSYESTFQERFEREARFIAGFNHPGIVQVYDFAVVESGTHKLFYMVMPFISGHTLTDLLEHCRDENKPVPHKRVRQIMLELADALGYAHDRGMIHRDVKPGNILFDENNRTILTDFGIARLAQQSGLTQDGLIVGTPAYMSPEQATAQEV